jgi:GMP synthase-like glutamine amidotransferase
VRALVIQHDHLTDSGRIGTRLAERGYDLTVLTVVPEARHTAPDVPFDFPDAADWDLVVSFGAPWSVYDDTSVGSWIGGELALLRKARHLGIPVLGVCFGAQVLTTALGGSVRPAPRPEIGWTEIETDLPGVVPPGPWFQWHFDRCVLPPGVTELARNAVCPQAFRAGRSLGVQFHPEITTDVLRGWLDNGGAEQCARHGVDPAELLARTRRLEPQAREQASRLVDAFLDEVASGPAV